MLRNTRPILAFTVIALGLVLIILLNFYQAVLFAPFSPLISGLVLLGSLILVLGIVLFFWLREKEINRLKQEFVTIVTHKFRTPLSGMKWAIEMLHDNVTFQRKEDLLKEIERANQRIVQIVDLLTGFATYDTDTKRTYEFISLRALVDNSLQKYAEIIREKKINFQIDSGKEPPWVYIDKSKIQFVVDVLLENALRYGATGGLVNVLIYRDRNFITLKMQDAGIGIRAEDVGHVFERFWRSAEAQTIDTEGMGLSLNTARAIVEHHGGRMWVESKGPGQGATFFVQLRTGGH